MTTDLPTDSIMTTEAAPHLFIHGATLLDPKTGAQKRADLLIRDGRIAAIGAGIDASDAPAFDATGKMVSIGWMDMHVHLREPGFEYKET
ncbi:MAG: hypothetical protein O2899_01310, partial [Bacteroidetes bacterium]|nr:hypothetical protein [Bacteroidota bacterium]